MTTTDLIFGAAAFEQLTDEWDALAQRGMTDTPFQTLAYQRAWWTHLGPGLLTTITVRDDDQLHAIGCFYVVDGIVHFNGCVEETDYLDLICAPDSAETAWNAVIDVICSADYPDWHTLEFCNIPEASPSRAILERISAERKLSFSADIQEVCPVIMLPTSFDAYLDTLDKKQRHEIRRKLRRAAGADAQLRIIGENDDLAEAIDAFLVLLQKSTIEKEAWLNDERRAVFHETAQAALEAGTLQLMFLEVDGQRAAALFNFAYNDRIWVYNSGLDPDAFGYLSSGVVLTAQAIEKAIEIGCREFDFLRGNETYKYQFGATDTEIYRLQLSR
ncbi:MAG: GNAT family N-acetyltransferase [Anaerolineae bacterium]|nr:GNAT family N-acetyltransferase [Anaerolineae bacterium]